MRREPVRPDIAELELTGISRIAVGAMHDPEVIPLWFGESDIVTPDFIREAAKKALDDGQTFYSSSRGTPALRAAILRYHERIYGLGLAEGRLIVPGSTMLAVTCACQCLLSDGDEMLLIGPYWPNIARAVAICGARIREVRLNEGPGRWSLDLPAVEAALIPETRAVYVNSPSNPTGWIMTAEEQRALLDLCRRRGVAVLSDEVYHRNVFTGRDPAPSFLEIAGEDEPVFVVNGLSKGWCMTGWRLGWLIGPARLAEPLAVLSECMSTGATVFAQAGAIAALEQGEEFLATFRERCRINRDLVMDILGGHPRVDLLEPEGAFYAFPRIEGVRDSLSLARRILHERKVGTAPGYTFGRGNDAHLRLCFAIDTPRLKEALERIVQVLDD